MIELEAQGDQLAFAKQEIIDSVLDLQNVDFDEEIRQCLAQIGNRARHHDVCNAWHRTNLEFGTGATLDSRNDKLQIFDLVVHAVDLAENGVGLRGRAVAATAPAEQLDTNRSLRVLHDPADAGR